MLFLASDDSIVWRHPPTTARKRTPGSSFYCARVRQISRVEQLRGRLFGSYLIPVTRISPRPPPWTSCIRIFMIVGAFWISFTSR